MAEQRTFDFEGGWVAVNVDADVMGLPRDRRDALFALLDAIEVAVAPLGLAVPAAPVVGTKAFGCGECERSFGTEHGMLVHQRRVHKAKAAGPPRPFECEQCSATFPTALALRSHVGQAHKRKPVPAPPPAKVEEKPKGNPLDRFGDPGPIGKRPFDPDARRGAAAGSL